jgi:hypothetical protein
MTAVEIKVTLEGDIDDALRRLPSEAQPERRHIGFLEYANGGSNLPLLGAGITLRVRMPDGAGKTESTAKLRPCASSQLTDRWARKAADGKPVRVEFDWAGDRKVLAASFDAKIDPDDVTAALEGRNGVKPLFTEEQEEFLEECTPFRLRFGVLRLFGMIEATKWEQVSVGPVTDVTVERWKLDRLDFLELSVRSEEDKAAKEKDALERALGDLGLAVAAQQPLKTRVVLEHLVGR